MLKGDRIAEVGRSVKPPDGARIIDAQGGTVMPGLVDLVVELPRGAANDPVRGVISDINQRIAKLHDGVNVHYLDIGARFLDDQGNLPKSLMPDQLHPGPAGYRVFAEAVAPEIKRLLKR